MSKSRVIVGPAVAELLAGFRSPSEFCAHTGTKLESLASWVRGRVRPGSGSAARIAVRTARDPAVVEALLLKIYEAGRAADAEEQRELDGLAEVGRP